MLYMVIEQFRDGDPESVYRRLEEEGRLMPPGLEYHGSWVERSRNRCFQLVECEDPGLLEQWVGEWDDLVDFEFVPVEAGSKVQEDLTGAE